MNGVALGREMPVMPIPPTACRTRVRMGRRVPGESAHFADLGCRGNRHSMNGRKASRLDGEQAVCRADAGDIVAVHRIWLASREASTELKGSVRSPFQHWPQPHKRPHAQAPVNCIHTHGSTSDY